MSEVKRYIVATLPGRMTRDCVEVVKARDYDALKAENARLREAFRYVRRTINPIGSWVTIGEAVPMVDNAIACIDAALAPQEKGK
jgi:hypothetical protein